ncbi:hypothetical protein [Streptomyces sp. NPDC001410]|uniref:hypothetical protein n=1 Tax=Streptomyces sp. NPDC001410 TaxID=3364574 RepID=UPI00369E1E41
MCKYVRRGREIARRVARFLGPRWVVRYWDEQHQGEKFVCWGCDRLHWIIDAHGDPPHPLDITVEGEWGLQPRRRPVSSPWYEGLANGGLAALTSVTWQGDHQVKPR